MPIPEAGADLPKEATGGDIPAEAASVPDTIEAPETTPYLISFKNYKEGECELNGGGMEPYAHDALKAIKALGISRPMSKPGTTNFGVRTERVYNDNEYSNLFKGLDDPELEMLETKLEGEKTEWDFRNAGRGRPKKITKVLNSGRIFFYAIDRTIFIVALRANHYETDKR